MTEIIDGLLQGSLIVFVQCKFRLTDQFKAIGVFFLDHYFYIQTFTQHDGYSAFHS